MRRKATVRWTVAGTLLVAVLGLGFAIYDVHFRYQGGIVLHGDAESVKIFWTPSC